MNSCFLQAAFVFFGLSLSINAFSSIDGDMNSFFKGLGYQSNVTTPHAFQGQAAGYYSGGSLFLRNQVKNYQIMSIDMPSFSGGCSGIDAYLGSFSVINTAQLTQMMKNILSAGGSYAFDLALTTAVPQMKSVKDYIQRYVTDINQSNINSCNTAEDLVGGMWPKEQNAQQQVCRDIGSHTGVFSDWAQARQGCGVGGDFEKGIGDGGSRKNEVIVNKNIVWSALQGNGLTASDTEVSEMLMSLSGSIIVKDEKGKVKQTTLMSMAHSQDIIKALLKGGEAKIYSCDETTKCLNPSIRSVSISSEHGLVSQVSSMITQLNADIASDSSSLSNKTRGFLEMTPVPVLKYITTSLSLGKSINPGEFSELIAISLLDQYLSESIQEVQQALSQEDSVMTPKMAAQINQAESLIAEKMSASYKKLANIGLLEGNMRANETQLVSRLYSQASVGQEAR